MSSDSFWSNACAFAQSKSLQTLLVAVYASCSVTVTFPRAAAAAALSFTSLILAFPRTDCGVLCERCGGRENAFFMVAHDGGGSAARVAAVRMVYRADTVRHLLRCCLVGSSDDETCEFFQRRRYGEDER